MSDNDERLKNLLLFQMYLTDKEMADAGPVACLILSVIAIVGAIVYYFHRRE